MPVLLRSATEADVKRVESLLAELGYPSKEGDVRHRLRRSLHSDTSCVLLAQSASEVIGLVSAELVPYYFAHERHCSGIEITSAEHRLDAHRFYQRLGFSRTSFRFFQAL